MDLTAYRALGRSGLIVSPLALGTMTFGTPGWGASREDCAAIFDAYVEAGGNLIDTAEVYAGGASEEIVGELTAARGLRDRLVLSTKFGWNADPGAPNSGGAGRKNIRRAVEGSLRRLRTDYIDLYWLHFWDMVTPLEETLDTLVDLVRSGLIRHYALSDVPAWYATRLATLAHALGWPGPVALQLEYSLVERTAEQEHLPAGRECGFGLMPWSPLAGGFLTGKYSRDAKPEAGRLSGANPFGGSKFNDRNWAILDEVTAVAADLGVSPAQVALAWVAGRPGVDSTLIGASRPEQLRDNLAALAVELDADTQARLDKASQPERGFPYSGYTPQIQSTIFGGRTVSGWLDRR